MGNYYYDSPNKNVQQNKYTQNPYQSYKQTQFQDYNTQGDKQQQNLVEEYNAMQAMKYIQEYYPAITNMNMANHGYSGKVKEQRMPKFFVIKSFTEEDIHKVRKPG